VNQRIAVQAVDPSVLTGPPSFAVIAFWVLGAAVILGALMTITRRNPVAAVISLVGTFFGIAAVYALLSAHFLAALQVLVYAGAIMVLFIFVVMVLNRDEIDPWVFRGWFGKVLVGVPVVGYLVSRLVRLGLTVVPQHPETPPAEFGTVAAVGEVLFTEYVFAFEAVSIVLLIAVIGAVVVARSVRHTGDIDKTGPVPEHPGAARS
jgi:NADH-quinone oxidoreductase subunit J